MCGIVFIVDGAFLATGWLLFILLCMPMTYMGRSTGLFLYGASLTLPLTLLLVKSTAWFKRLKQHYVAL